MLSTKILSAMAASAPAAESDPYFSNVSLLLHFNGTNGSQSFVDSSGSPKVITAFGNAQSSTASNKFGVSSVRMDGNGDYLVAGYSNEFDMGSGDFTIEFFVNPLTAKNSSFIRNANADSYAGYGISMQSNRTVKVTNSLNGTSWAVANSSTATIPLNAWTHIALCRAGGTEKMYFDGVQVFSTTSLGSSSIYGGQPIYIGNSRWVGDYEYPDAYIDEVRITKGISRYSANFTPPSTQFPNQ